MTATAMVSAGSNAELTSREDVRGEWTFLLLATAVLVLSVVLRTSGPSTVVIPGWDVALPDTCTLRRFAGIDCPGCGLTRSFIHLAHGDLGGAWAFHPVGPLIFALVAVQIPYRGWQIWRSRSGRGVWRPGIWIHVPLGVIITLMIGRWIMRLVMGDLGAT